MPSNSWVIAIIIELHKRLKILLINICWLSLIQEMSMSTIFSALNHQSSIFIDHLMLNNVLILIHISDQLLASQFHHLTNVFSWLVLLMGRFDYMIYRKRKRWLPSNLNLENTLIQFNGHHSDQQYLLQFQTQVLYTFMIWSNLNKKSLKKSNMMTCRFSLNTDKLSKFVSIRNKETILRSDTMTH